MLAENKMVHHSVWTQLEHCCALLWFVIRILDKTFCILSIIKEHVPTLWSQMHGQRKSRRRKR